MNKAGSLNNSEKWFWMPRVKEGFLCVYMFVFVCLGIEATDLD